jgi:hypothetical protein
MKSYQREQLKNHNILREKYKLHDLHFETNSNFSKRLLKIVQTKILVLLSICNVLMM